MSFPYLWNEIPLPFYNLFLIGFPFSDRLGPPHHESPRSEWRPPHPFPRPDEDDNGRDEEWSRRNLDGIHDAVRRDVPCLQWGTVVIGECSVMVVLTQTEGQM